MFQHENLILASASQIRKQLLADAGYPEGFELNLYSPSGRYPMDKEVAQAVGDQLFKIGIKPNIHIMETGKYFKDFIIPSLFVEI